MAAIDKTYYRTYSEYKEVRDWCASFGIVQDKYGNRFNPLDFLYDWNMTEKEFEEKKKEFIARNPGRPFYQVLWNTPTYFDIWLIRNCNIPLIVETLELQYNQEFIEKAKLGALDCDTYQRNGLGKRARVTILKRPDFNYRTRFWHIEVNGDIEKDGYWSYAKDIREWNCTKSCKASYGSSAYTYPGYLSLRALIRKIRSWNLPEGVEVEATGRYIGQEWRVKVRK